MFAKNFGSDNILPYVEIFNYKIAMYGAMIIIGATFAIILACYRKNHYSIKREDILFSSFYAGIGALIGSKILYIFISMPEIIRNWAVYTKSLKHFLSIIQGGFVFYGGLIGALIGILIYAKSYKINVLHLFETLTPSIPLFHAFGRIGCFCAGCCYGKPFSPPLGICFNSSPVAPHHVHLFPVQLFESGLNLLLFIFLFILSAKKRKLGSILGYYIAFYSTIRFILEFYRYDYIRGFLFGISTSQWFSIILFPVGIFFILRPQKHSNN